MVSIVMQNPEVDPKAAALIQEALGAITPQWKELLPSRINVTLGGKPLSQIKELKEFWAAQPLPKSHRKSVQVACPEFSKGEATFWIHYNEEAVMAPPEYYFKKELYAVLAQIMWALSKKLREIVSINATGVAEGNEGAQYAAFRDSFSRFFLNPEWLAERKPAAWAFVNKVNRALLPRRAA